MFWKYCCLFIMMMSVTAIGYAGDVDKKCPEGQKFDKEKGICVLEDTGQPAPTQTPTVPDHTK